MYYWTLLNKSDNELVKKAFEVQKNHFEQVKSDMNLLDLAMTEQDIKEMNKEKFKTLVKKKLKATHFLFKFRENHSKHNI